MDGLEQFTKLTKLDCSKNYLKELPDLSNIEELIFENNNSDEFLDFFNLYPLPSTNRKFEKLPDLPLCKLFIVATVT